jgi:hypothetical protein
MAVKRAAALLSDPKLEDEGSESTTSKRDQGRDANLNAEMAETRYLSLLAE